LNFVGRNAGLYSGEPSPFTTTTTIPLSSFNLQDTVDQGVTSYSAQIGFTATADIDAFSAYMDNIRLEQISTPDLLTLEINRSNGVSTLKNLSPNPISWDLFDIKSVGGSLNPSGWNSLDDQDADGAGTWVEGGGSSATEIAEASLLGSHTLNPGATLSLGALYNPLVHVDDLNFTIRRAAGPLNRTYDQNVTYIGTPPAGVAGDYNGNGIVDAADYVVWRKGGTLQNDPTPGIQPADYTFWRSRFGQVTGSGSGLAGTANVPEPTTVFLAFVGLAATCALNWRS
jgi:hypothetical protein